MQDKTKFRRIILDLFDGSDAGAAEGTGDGGSTSAVDHAAAQRGRELGLDDDLLEDYAAAFGKGNGSGGRGGSEDDDTEDTVNENDNNEGAENDEDLDAEFEELVKGKFKGAFQKRVGKDISDRVNRAKRDMAALKSKAAKSDRVLALLAEKYGDADPDKLYDAVRQDNDLWRQAALDSGGTVDDVIKGFDNKQAAEAQKQELENLRQYKAANELNNRLQALAMKTRETYPDFNLEAEFNNPKFRQALDIIAESNENLNKANGTQNEIFDVTFAYEMAHADELRANTIKRTAKAAASAAMQTMQANRSRPQENAAKRTSPGKAKSYSEMTDKEFEAELERIECGEAKIRR